MCWTEQIFSAVRTRRERFGAAASRHLPLERLSALGGERLSSAVLDILFVNAVVAPPALVFLIACALGG